MSIIMITGGFTNAHRAHSHGKSNDIDSDPCDNEVLALHRSQNNAQHIFSRNQSISTLPPAASSCSFNFSASAFGMSAFTVCGVDSTNFFA